MSSKNSMLVRIFHTLCELGNVQTVRPAVLVRDSHKGILRDFRDCIWQGTLLIWGVAGYPHFIYLSDSKLLNLLLLVGLKAQIKEEVISPDDLGCIKNLVKGCIGQFASLWQQCEHKGPHIGFKTIPAFYNNFKEVLKGVLNIVTSYVYLAMVWGHCIVP